MFISELVPLIWRQRVLLREISELIQRAFNAVVADLRENPAGPSPEHLDVLRVSKPSLPLHLIIVHLSV